MSKVNIQGIEDIIDPFYRYQREKINFEQLKNKGVIKNLDQICKDIDRDKDIILKYFQSYFGSNFILKKDGFCYTPKNIDKNSLEQALNYLIEYIILCPVCRLPETTLDFDKKKIMMFCKCCSFSGNIKIKDKIMARTMDSILKKHK